MKKKRKGEEGDDDEEEEDMRVDKKTLSFKLNGVVSALRMHLVMCIICRKALLR